MYNVDAEIYHARVVSTSSLITEPGFLRIRPKVRHRNELWQNLQNLYPQELAGRYEYTTESTVPWHIEMNCGRTFKTCTLKNWLADTSTRLKVQSYAHRNKLWQNLQDLHPQEPASRYEYTTESTEPWHIWWSRLDVCLQTRESTLGLSTNGRLNVMEGILHHDPSFSSSTNIIGTIENQYRLAGREQASTSYKGNLPRKEILLATHGAWSFASRYGWR